MNSKILHYLHLQNEDTRAHRNEMICQWSCRKEDVELSLEHISSDFKSQLHQAVLSNVTSEAESEGGTSSLSTTSYLVWYMCGSGHVHPHSGGCPEVYLLGLTPLYPCRQSCVLERYLLQSLRWQGLGHSSGLAQPREAALYRWWCGWLHSGRASQYWRARLCSFRSRSDNIPLLAAMYSLLQSCASKWLCSSFTYSPCKLGNKH